MPASVTAKAAAAPIKLATNRNRGPSRQTQPRVENAPTMGQAPAGDLLWVCENHYRDYDPGMPVIQ